MSEFFKDLISARRIVDRDISFEGRTKKVYFRELTAGERAAISRGQRVRLRNETNDNQEENKVLDVDAGDIMQRTHRFLSYCCVDDKGKQAFRGEKEVAELPESLVSALQSAANDAMGEFGQVAEPETVGN